MPALPEPLSAMERLRGDTALLYRRIEALPFFNALAGGVLPLANAESVPKDAVSLLYARLLAEQITRQARRDPPTLLGCLYVLEGATPGGKLV